VLTASIYSKRITLGAHLLCRFPHGAHPLLNVETRVPSPPDHVDHTLQASPAVQANISDSRNASEVTHCAGKQGMPSYGLNRYYKALPFDMAR